MKIKNLTSEMKSLRVADLTDGREFDIYIEGNSCTDITGMYISDMSKLSPCFEIVGKTTTIKEEYTPVENHDSNEEDITEVETEAPQDIVEEDSAEVEDTTDEEDITKEDEVTSLSDKFICDICGAEFASERGLTSHKTRTHS